MPDTKIEEPLNVGSVGQLNNKLPRREMSAFCIRTCKADDVDSNSQKKGSSYFCKLGFEVVEFKKWTAIPFCPLWRRDLKIRWQAIPVPSGWSGIDYDDII